MSVIDTSALMAILFQELDADRHATAIAADAAPKISAATMVEAGAVALRRGGPALLHALESMVAAAGISVVDSSATQSALAIDAYRRYGLGVGAPACLNFGDCFAYALAKDVDEPLLYQGNDFAKTDVIPAL